LIYLNKEKKKKMKFNKAIVLSILAASAEAYDLLKDFSNGFRIGAATNTRFYNNANYVNAMKAFNYMVAENACKFVSIQGQKGNFNFNDCDNHLKKAKELGMDFRGHALIWHSMAPQWLEREDSNTMRQSIVNHITKVLQHYDGKIDTWDVVNEAIDDSSNGNGWKYRNSFLYQKNKDFIDLAFKTARQVAPKVKLFYNDYNTEGIWGKSESVYQFIADLKKRNIPIDGVGLQYHVSVQHQPQLNKITDLISRYCQLGLEVHITELDVSCEGACNAGDVQNKQGQVFSNALKACLTNSCCTGFLVWGIGDNDSWLGADKKGLLFDGSYKPKSQYNALLNVLKSTKAASLGNKPANNGGNTGGNAQPVDDAPVSSTFKPKKMADGWYRIKNPESGLYLNVADGEGADSQNVELGEDGQQMWKLTNVGNNYVTLTSSLGEFNLDVCMGEDENGTNAQIYSIHNEEPQQFVVMETETKNVYVIGTRGSNGSKVLDIENYGTTPGSNVYQWENEGKANQLWTLEPIQGTISGGDETSSNESKPSNDESCWAKSLGYSCCKSCGVVMEDDSGKWGIENGDWCGIAKTCSSKCIGAAGYPCCSRTCIVQFEDESGKWGIENNDWCIIDRDLCIYLQ
jgi:endo-1,4-beta-xylanase